MIPEAHKATSTTATSVFDLLIKNVQNPKEKLICPLMCDVETFCKKYHQHSDKTVSCHQLKKSPGRTESLGSESDIPMPPGRAPPTTTTGKRTFMIPVSLLRIKAGTWSRLYVVHSEEHEVMYVEQDSRSLTRGGVNIQLRSLNIHTLFCSGDYSAGILLLGTKDKFSLGRIRIGFSSADCYDAFLDVIAQMRPNPRVDGMDEEILQHVLESSEEFFKPAEHS
ncbi:hypothetical protein E4T47_02229 [Aureobasidium subglaciale]|nr:hypothetical protein E4T47_02229 [Aureobasidium subglaciale]